MIKRIFNSIINRQTFFRNSSILAVTTLVSYVLGLLRDRTFATVLGASRELDAYNAAFNLPDLILNIFVAGALSAAFVPIFTGLMSNKKDKEADEFTSSVINSSLLVVILAGFLVFFFAPQLSHLIVPGFEENYRTIFVNITRLLLLSPLIFAISNTLGNILVSKERFFWYGISPALYNIGIICGTLFLVPYFGIYGIPIGAIIGALLHLAARIIGLNKDEFKYKLKILLNSDYKKFLRLMTPKMIGHPIEQLTFLGFTAIASTLGAGAIAILNFSRNFQSVPINIIGITISITAFPILSRATANRDWTGFTKELGFALKLITVMAIPTTIFIYIFRYQIISIFLGGGIFGKESITLTAITLGAFSLAILTESIGHLLARSFYALRDSLTPTLASIGGLVFAIGTGWIFSSRLGLGVEGLGFGYLIGSILKVSVQAVFLKRKTKNTFTSESEFKNMED